MRAGLVLLLALATGSASAHAAHAAEAAKGRVLVVGAPRAGPLEALVTALRTEDDLPVEVPALPDPLPWNTEVVVLAAAPPDAAAAERWSMVLAGFVEGGGMVAARPGSPGGNVVTAMLARTGADVLGRVELVSDAAGTPGAAARLAAPRFVVRHPAAGPEPGVRPALFRVPAERPGGRLPPRTLVFLAVVVFAFGGTAAVLRRRGAGPLRALGLLGAVTAGGCGLLLLPGVAPAAVHRDRWVVEERAGPAAAAVRRVVLVRLERVRPGADDPVVTALDGAAAVALRFDAGAAAAVVTGDRIAVPLAAPGHAALVGAAGGASPSETGPFLAELRVRGNTAEQTVAGEGVRSVALATALRGWSRDRNPRVARAGALLAELLVPRTAAGRFTVRVPATGPLAVVIHEPAR